MGQPEIPKIEELTEELALWKTFSEISSNKEIDIRACFSDLATNIEEKLEPEIQAEFQELCVAGCFREVLILLLEFLRNSSHLQPTWTKWVGHSNEKRAKALENAAKELEFLFGEDSLVGDGVDPDILTRIGRIPVLRLVAELRFYAGFFTLAERLAKDIKTRSPVEFAKYVFTGYVKRMTGDFHDRCVSGLIGELVGPKDYAETAHAMWRSRNYKRLDGHHSEIARLLVAMSVVANHQA
jgi:hypothetical protein